VTTKKKTKKRKNGRVKGSRAELAVAKLFSTWWGSDFARTPQSGGFRTRKFREDWNAEGDLVTPDETFPFSVEVKCHEGWTLDNLLTGSDTTDLWCWWDQAIDQAGDIKQPLLVFKRNHMPWYYCMWEEFGGHLLPSDKPKLYVPHRSVVVGLLSSLFETDKKVWLK
jgi:hypothetical protein